ncbi:Kinase superfamily protein [Hibiscus syriacus]|uniref:Kinase superfamily protein n=1 Tax=Hibiscus syriacus TaxID=106335 RepID=A0A6A3CIP7_HIBSY|nr:Kinase superfamily protein [Hibiscus syriacus]
MAVSKPDRNIVINDDNNCAEDDQEEQEKMDCISSHLYLKPSHSKQTLDKHVVLRRIRHRKRINNFRSALQSFIGSSSPAKINNKASGHEIKWVDDAFAAL